MATVAHESDLLADLEAGTARAWMTYRDRLRGLAGEEYERIEPECWAALQRELRRLERRHKLLAGIPA